MKNSDADGGSLHLPFKQYPVQQSLVVTHADVEQTHALLMHSAPQQSFDDAHLAPRMHVVVACTFRVDMLNIANNIGSAAPLIESMNISTGMKFVSLPLAPTPANTKRDLTCFITMQEPSDEQTVPFGHWTVGQLVTTLQTPSVQVAGEVQPASPVHCNVSMQEPSDEQAVPSGHWTVGQVATIVQDPPMQVAGEVQSESLTHIGGLSAQEPSDRQTGNCGGHWTVGQVATIVQDPSMQVAGKMQSALTAHCGSGHAPPQSDGQVKQSSPKAQTPLPHN